MTFSTLSSACTQQKMTLQLKRENDLLTNEKDTSREGHKDIQRLLKVNQNQLFQKPLPNKTIFMKPKSISSSSINANQNGAMHTAKSKIEKAKC